MLLTKDLIKVRIKDGRAFPVFLSEDLAKARDLAATMIEVGTRLSGSTIEEFKEALDLEADATLPYFKGMMKVFLGFSTSEDPDDLSEKRRDYLLISEDLRKKCEGSLENFRKLVADKTSKSFSEISASLYADLPDFSLITMPDNISPPALLGMYNRAHLRGLMLTSNAIDLEVTGNLGQIRKLLRAAKFHRLILESTELGEKNSRFRISGPLSLGASNIAYGAKLASFMNHVIDLPAWKIQTEVHLRSEDLKLELASGKVFFGAPETHDAYIPEELQTILGQHTYQKSSVEIKNNTNIFTVGNQIIVPDFAVEHKDRVFYIEVFHKWHQSGALKSLSNPEALRKNGLVLALDKSLIKELKTQNLLEKVKMAGVPVIEFRDFPTIRSILDIFTSFPNFGVLKPRGTSADY
jgi:predicted nuclease of restriction endonuclease-like RecB superfamily